MKIGLFDSGSGLFTVAQAIRRLNPQADLILYSDLANMPYGERSLAELQLLMEADLEALKQADADIFVSACNTLSVTLLQGDMPPRVIEMVEPIARDLRASGIAQVAVVGTPATIGSGLYTQVLARHGITATAIAIPGLAAAIEEERTGDAQSLIQTHLAEKDMPDIGILACTHYPLIRPLFEKVCPNTRWLDPAEAVARAVIDLAGLEGEGSLRVITTAPPTPAYKKLQQKLAES
jgi:glutamate racemase